MPSAPADSPPRTPHGVATPPPHGWPGPDTPGRGRRAARDRLVHRLVHRALDHDPVALRRAKPFELATDDHPADELVVFDADAGRISDVFHRLRWGGRAVLALTDPRAALELTRRYGDHGGFVVEKGPDALHVGPLGLTVPFRVPLLTHGLSYTVVRKTALIEPDERTDRFTFDVKLERVPRLGPDYVVTKTVPRYRTILDRLTEKYPDQSRDQLLSRTDKLVKRVFPVFLTREAAFLQLLQRDLPPGYRHRVPKPLGVEKAADGTVRKLYMSWLRLSGGPMSQLEFAQQAADLLRAVHDQAKVIHLDLRLDNMVIHEGRVCFVDFGSSVRVGENLDQSPMLRSLFHEMMQTSQIQRHLGKMKEEGYLTSDVLLAAHGRVDIGVDLFYLALQLARPYWNPDLVPLIRFDEDSREARLIRQLSRAILRPRDPLNPAYRTAADVVRGLERVHVELSHGPA